MQTPGIRLWGFCLEMHNLQLHLSGWNIYESPGEAISGKVQGLSEHKVEIKKRIKQPQKPAIDRLFAKPILEKR